MTGATSYYAGVAAEEIAERYYLTNGCLLVARRWRGKGGEVDLIFRKDAEVIFVEVKKSATFDKAVASLGARQMKRIYAAASEFIAGEPAGQDTAVRFDAALVDGTGQLRVIENAFGHF